MAFMNIPATKVMHSIETRSHVGKNVRNPGEQKKGEKKGAHEHSLFAVFEVNNKNQCGKNVRHDRGSPIRGVLSKTLNASERQTNLIGLEKREIKTRY